VNGLLAPAFLVISISAPLLFAQAETEAPEKTPAPASTVQKKDPSKGGMPAGRKIKKKSRITERLQRCPKRPTEDQFKLYNRISDRLLLHKQRASRLDAEARRLADVRRQIQAQREELLKLQAKLDEKLTEKELEEATARAARIRKLVKIYESMQVASAAATAGSLSMDLLVELLLRMKPKKAAGVLNLVPRRTAAKSFEEISRRRKGMIEALLEQVDRKDP
jgi:flagellar motility protein MotE (MotC chaperone)